MRLPASGWTDVDGSRWEYFTSKAEAEAASLTGYVLETSPGTIWRTVVEKGKR